MRKFIASNSLTGSYFLAGQGFVAATQNEGTPLSSDEVAVVNASYENVIVGNRFTAEYFKTCFEQVLGSDPSEHDLARFAAIELRLYDNNLARGTELNDDDLPSESATSQTKAK